ncbi:MAG: sigma-70 family RNA polymerase sigma factor [Desulfurobacteriaceae bacterium]
MYRKSRRDLVLENLPLVKKVANKIYRRIPEGAVDFDELVNVGVIGLMKAIDNYDSEKAKFSTYAYIKIRGEILDFLRKLDFLPRNVREKVKNGNVEDLKDEVISLISIEESLFSNSDKYTVKDILVSKERTPEEEAILREIEERLMEALNCLSEREKLVLQLIFVEELDLKSISEVLGISVSRVSQIKGTALRKLREFLSDKL